MSSGFTETDSAPRIFAVIAIFSSKDQWRGRVGLPSSGAMGLTYNVLHQQTLRQAASFSGVGLHSGNRVNMTFLPAPPNYGIRFRRLDLEGSPEIEARIEHVSTT